MIVSSPSPSSSSSSSCFQALWTKNGASIVYPCHAIIVSMEVSTGQQQFFMGHTDKVHKVVLCHNFEMLFTEELLY